MRKRVLNIILSVLGLSFCITANSFTQPETDFLFSKNKMEKEVWKDVPGYEKSYQASTFGRIKSLKRKVNHPKGGLKTVNEKILKPVKLGGYRHICLGRKNPILIHRIVAKTFIPNPLNKPCVNHIDGDKKNNKLSNLGWVTYSENEKHSYSHLGKQANKNNLGNVGIKSSSSKQVLQLDKHSSKIINVFESVSLAVIFLSKILTKYKVAQGTISTNCRGETKTCYGYRFQYISKKRFKQLLKKKSNN